MSGDPLLQEPKNGQSYNRYSYVLNNPTNNTDPTGFCAVVTGSHICKSGQALTSALVDVGALTQTQAAAYNQLAPIAQQNASIRAQIKQFINDGFLPTALALSENRNNVNHGGGLLSASWRKGEQPRCTDVAPAEVLEARARNPELSRHEKEIWIESKSSILYDLFGVGEPAREQALIVYKNNKDGTLLYDTQYKSSYNPRTGEYSSIELPHALKVPKGYSLFIFEHTHPFGWAMGGFAGPRKGPSPDDGNVARDYPGAYHILQARPPFTSESRFFYYGQKSLP